MCLLINNKNIMKEFLKDIINEAGKRSLKYYANIDSLTIDKKSDKDLVSEADKSIESFLVKAIKSRFPEHGIFGEETGEHKGNTYRWIIDPIDGTTSFLHHQPFYSISIALEKNGTVILGAVNAPVLKELFIAELGKGAYCNDHPIHVSKRNLLINSVLGTGFACVRSDCQHNNIPYFTAVLPLIRGIRRYGSAAIDLCYCACARLDGFWELNLKLYDIAAGKLIAQEAGATVTNFKGNANHNPDEIAVTNGLIHNELVNILTNIQKNVIH